MLKSELDQFALCVHTYVEGYDNNASSTLENKVYEIFHFPALSLVTWSERETFTAESTNAVILSIRSFLSFSDKAWISAVKWSVHRLSRRL